MRALLAVLALAAPFARAADEPKAGSVSPKGAPVKAELVVKETTFALDLGGMTPEGYAKQIADAGNGKAKAPPPPAVALTLVVTNTSDKAVQIWKSGDPVTIEFVLTGPGAVQIAPPLAMTMEFRIPAAVEVAPGKTLEFPIKSLSGGLRGVSKSTYWTKPGEYELSAVLKTGVSPAPAGAKEQDGFGLVTLTTAPLKVTVEAKK